MRPTENSITFEGGGDLRRHLEESEDPATDEPVTEFRCHCGLVKPLAELRLAMVVDGVRTGVCSACARSFIDPPAIAAKIFR
jgi:hypothetical protein